jgi:hypothetical protein
MIMPPSKRWLDNSKRMSSHDLRRERVQSMMAAPFKKMPPRVQVLDQGKVWKIFKRFMIVSGKSMNR